MTNAPRNLKIITLRKQGVGPREIARQLGVSSSTVAGVLFRAGMTDPSSPNSHVVPRNQPPQTEPAFRALVLEAAEHEPVAGVCRSWDISSAAFYRWRKDQVGAA
jgi:transposase-like protein